MLRLLVVGPTHCRGKVKSRKPTAFATAPPASGVWVPGSEPLTTGGPRFIPLRAPAYRA